MRPSPFTFEGGPATAPAVAARGRQAFHSSARGVLAPPPQPLTAATGRHSPSSAGRGLRRSPFGHFSGVRPQRGEKAARSARWRR
ncbi:hypothetical protein EMIHUDRAFT_460714 [Emiliania huxleyi CCMP1516]|uniref:Uncharacterized protein n=2 Tax=Emiliania huxleyi TaxID=2903 RepID=A0A0D3JXL7_EMIH1|nr:hypothetical protein EMIHUDRAFT_460714 [Emiliania huxleyi CCMP1516]EOD28252.1 hypothetical protein EMIHUDRAFT_460714 [Emiliania huxleyi CCMP1516]|eukprot:XP_005780681.1 hypothetical protein EMIHUDRAFT_460714 [Emiliania huxleyi CCMP1516]